MKLPEGFRRAPPPALDGSEDDVEEGIRFHIDSRTEDLVAQGVAQTPMMR